MKITILYLISCCFVFHSFSQKIDENIDLTQFFSGDSINENISISSKAKIDSIYRWYLSNYQLNDEFNAYKEFVYRYNYQNEKLIKSGKVFGKNEISIYLNELKDRILNGRTEKNRIQVFLVDFDQLNAFTNDFGEIYVNVGTIARLETEQELIFILAHEIAHILSRHSYQLESLDEKFTNKSKIEKINEISESEYHKYSRNQEMEADSLAYILLTEAKIAYNHLESLFHKLKYCNNPIFNDSVKLMEILAVNQMTIDHIEGLSSLPEVHKPQFQGKSEDSLTTHPSVEKRFELYQKMRIENSDSIRYIEIGRPYEYYKNMASMVMVKTLMLNSKYSESLYLIGQLFKRFPGCDYLVSNKLKNLILLDQEKYLSKSIFILNEYRESCNDLSFLRFKYLLLRSSALDLNLLTIENIQDAIKINNIEYYHRMKDFSYQFLYKYNPFLIANDSIQLVLKTDRKNKLKIYFDPVSMYTSDLSSYVIKLKDEGLTVIEQSYKDTSFLVKFIVSFNDYQFFNESIKRYKLKRDCFENLLSLNQVKDVFKDNYFRSDIDEKYILNLSISDTSKILLFQSDTYYLDIYQDDIKMNYSKTLDTEEMIYSVRDNVKFKSNKLAKMTMNSRSVSENYLHGLLSNWINESLNFTDLMYSVVDEELYNYQSKNRFDYLVYNLNVIRQFGKSYYAEYYDFYFDLSLMGVAYVSFIKTEKKPKYNMLLNHFYKSYLARIK